MPSLEVEEKFSLIDRDLSELEDVLGENGFELAGEATIVDWYLDITENDSFELLRQDCWLRCRESKGQRTWQLKRGQTASNSKSAQASSGSVVYEEIEGAGAVKVACSLLKMNNDGGSVFSIEEGFKDETPSIRFADKCLDSFAKIVTHRSSWKVPPLSAPKEQSEMNIFRDLCVDLDVTDFDHAVGEVEALVQDPSEVEGARKQIKKLIDKIGGSSSNKKAEGKLEYFLRRNRPEVYQICISCGVL